MRGPDGAAPRDGWLDAVSPEREPAPTAAALVDSARLGLVAGLAAGVTTYADTSASGGSMPAMRELGVRGIVYQELSGPAPEQRADALAGLAESVARLRTAASDLVRVGVAPRSVHAVHEDLLIDACAYALGAGLPIAIPVAESEAEIAFLREAAGPLADALRARGVGVVRRAHSPVHLFVELGIDIAHPLLVHCVQLDPSDVAFIAERGCPVAHCPSSNAASGHGVAPVAELLAAGATVALGTGAAARGGRVDLRGEARVAALLQRARTRSASAVPAAQALELATLGGARALGLDAVVGSLEVGKDADLAAFSLGDAGVPTPDPAESAVFARPGRVASFVAVAGRPLVRDGRVLGADPDLARRAGAAGAALAGWRGGAA
jgi:5-methylthioadenosine/S-adenosylhomocysteine deaminase